VAWIRAYLLRWGSCKLLPGLGRMQLLHSISLHSCAIQFTGQRLIAGVEATMWRLHKISHSLPCTYGRAVLPSGVCDLALRENTVSNPMVAKFAAEAAYACQHAVCANTDWPRLTADAYQAWQPNEDESIRPPKFKVNAREHCFVLLYTVCCTKLHHEYFCSLSIYLFGQICRL
jgi:hypothetical protein